MSSLLPFVSYVLNFVATTPVHRVFFPYAFGPTLHAARISLAYQSNARRSAVPLSWGTYIVGYLIMCWGGAIITHFLLGLPPPMLYSFQPYINYLTVHLALTSFFALFPDVRSSSQSESQSASSLSSSSNPARTLIPLTPPSPLKSALLPLHTLLLVLLCPINLLFASLHTFLIAPLHANLTRAQLLHPRTLDTILFPLDAVLRTNSVVWTLSLLTAPSVHPQYVNSPLTHLILGALASAGGGLSAATLSTWTPNWSFRTPPVLQRGAGAFGTLDVWGGALVALIYSTCTGHPAFLRFGDSLLPYSLLFSSSSKGTTSGDAKAIGCTLFGILFGLRVLKIHWLPFFATNAGGVALDHQPISPSGMVAKKPRSKAKSGVVSKKEGRTSEMSEKAGKEQPVVATATGADTTTAPGIGIKALRSASRAKVT